MFAVLLPRAFLMLFVSQTSCLVMSEKHLIQYASKEISAMDTSEMCTVATNEILVAAVPCFVYDQLNPQEWPKQLQEESEHLLIRSEPA